MKITFLGHASLIIDSNRKTLFSYYFDTFGFIEIDKKFAKQKFVTAVKDLTLLNLGESISIR